MKKNKKIPFIKMNRDERMSVISTSSYYSLSGYNGSLNEKLINKRFHLMPENEIRFWMSKIQDKMQELQSIEADQNSIPGYWRN